MKQVIVVRKDLSLGKGKIAAQVGHACVKSITQYLDMDNGWDDNVNDWLGDGMSKVVVACNSEAELLQLTSKAKELGLSTALIQDAGLTQVDEGTYTCVAIGPDEDHLVDEITGHLKLL